MKNTKIEWAEHTINFWWGCTKVSAGCANCYAEGLDKRWHGGEHWGKGAPRKPRLEAARKEALALNRKAEREGRQYRIFANSMNDWLDPEVPIEWLAEMLDTIRITPNLTWMLLTKRPELWRQRVSMAFEILPSIVGGNRIGHYAWVGEWLKGGHRANIWIGASIENQKADDRISHLLKIPARVWFLSCEPLLGSVALPVEWAEPEDGGRGYIDGIHWVIAGGESGPNARPMHPDWARSLRDQCLAAGVPYFFKQWGEWRPPIAGEEYDTSTGRAQSVPAFLVAKNGTVNCYDLRDSKPMLRVGKKAAGRLLDGREWNQLPEGEQ